MRVSLRTSTHVKRLNLLFSRSAPGAALPATPYCALTRCWCWTSGRRPTCGTEGRRPSPLGGRGPTWSSRSGRQVSRAGDKGECGIRVEIRLSTRDRLWTTKVKSYVISVHDPLPTQVCARAHRLRTTGLTVATVNPNLHFFFPAGYDYSGADFPNPVVCAPGGGGGGDLTGPRPDWGFAGRVNQNMETALFKEKFADWPNGAKTLRYVCPNLVSNSAKVRKTLTFGHALRSTPPCLCWYIFFSNVLFVNLQGAQGRTEGGGHSCLRRLL